ncbi:serine/threonine-protein kinase [Streptomyces sp. NPDC090077]|uniref:serine/threonine-protein kinase n=1 Tax=Streptomyces sp. NPDC090077 TaxID=3365938 RepID=UPI003804C1DE
MRSTAPGGRVHPAHPGDPKTIGPYRILGRLGTGGMGTVHAALDPRGTRVAVKAVHQAQAQDPEFRARFRREVALSARVQGPCLVPLLAADTEAERPWLAAEYVPGPTLDRHLAAHGPLTGGSLYAFAAGTARALSAIHRAGVVHRDVKPQNVILSPAGPRMLDFGIAHAADGTSVTRTGVMTGTPGWISPEHYRSGTTGPAGDLFAWGALVAHAATGRLPFGSGAPDVVAFRVMSGDPDLDGVPAALREVVGEALAKAPADRPTAERAAARCAALLAAEATQLLAAGAAPTLAADPIAAQWHLPAVDDPAWPSPPAPGRGRLLLAVTVGAAVLGGAVGGLLALPAASRDGGRTAAGPAAVATPGNAARTTGTPAAPVPSGSGSPAADAKGAVDGGPTLATWRQARAARTPAEHDAHPSIGTGAWLDENAHPVQEFALTFHQPRGEVYVTSGGPELDGGALREVARTVCLGLRHLGGGYPDLPYDTFVIVDTGRGGGPAVVWTDDFRTNTTCSASLTDRGTDRGTGGGGTGDADRAGAGRTGRAADWYPAAGGLAVAKIPSSDADEIRVADRTATAVIDEWNGGSGAAAGGRLGHGNLAVGFDPAGRVMYVWAVRPQWDRGTREDWALRAARRACADLTAESARSADWPYARYAVFAEDASGGGEFLRWGTAGSCGD